MPQWIITWLIILVTGIYAAIGAGFLWNRNFGLGISYVAYAIANIGLILAANEMAAK